MDLKGPSQASSIGPDVFQTSNAERTTKSTEHRSALRTSSQSGCSGLMNRWVTPSRNASPIKLPVLGCCGCLTAGGRSDPACETIHPMMIGMPVTSVTTVPSEFTQSGNIPPY